jgi:hypothetical protein
MTCQATIQVRIGLNHDNFYHGRTRFPNLESNTIVLFAALSNRFLSITSIIDLAKKPYPLENIDLSIYISGYFYV